MRICVLTVILSATAMTAVAATPPALDRQFDQTIRPYVTKYCIGCHSGKSPAAQFDLKSYTDLQQCSRMMGYK